MKFLRVMFRNFGPFEEQTLDLSGPGGLRIVFGENEAGKSSALRGLLAFLFGFPGQSKDDFRFKYNQFRIHALLENANAEPLECIRRKGNKDTLRKTCDKEVIPERQLTDFLGGLDETQFEQLFGLDADRLRKGGDTIAKFEGQLGEALFAAGAGMKELRILSQRLVDRQEKLYLPGGRKQLITEAIREHRDLVAEARKLDLPPETYAEAEAVAMAAAGKVEELTRERLTARARLTLFNRFKAALPTIDLLRTARARLDEVADAPILSADFDAKLEKAREKLTTATSELGNLETDRRKLTEQVEKEQPSAAVLNEENEIGELKKQVGADAKAREEGVKAETFSIDERGKARDIYRELTGSTEWEQMDGLKPRLDERNRITKLANERSAAVEAFSGQEKAAREAKQALAEARNKQNETPFSIDPQAWQDAADDVSAAGPLEKQLAQFTNDVQTEERRLADEFARFNPAPPGTWQEAPALPVPLAESVEWFRQQLENARSVIDKVASEKSKTEKEMAAIRAALIDKVGSEPVPTTDELTAARRDRDGGLHGIRLRLAGRVEEPSEVEFTARHAPGRALIDAVEGSVRHCDTLADRLRHEADRVAAYQSLQQQIKALQDRLATLVGEARAANDALTALEQRWQAAWQPTGIRADVPKVMQSWLANWAKFLERVAIWQGNCAHRNETRQRVDELRARLSNACPAAKNAKTLAEGLTLAKRAIAEATTARSKAIELGAEVKRLQDAVEKAEGDEVTAKTRRTEWERQWSAAVAVLRLNDASPSIETAQDYLKRIDQMQQHLKDMRIKKARVHEIESDRHGLIERINALRRRLEPAARPTTAESLDADFRGIELALQQASAQRTRHQEFSKQLDDIEKKLSRTRANLTEARAALAALAAEARVEPDAIPAAVQRARQRAAEAAQVRQYEEALAQIALGEPMEDFIASALAQREDLNQQLEALARQVDRLDGDVSTAEAESNEAQRIVDGYRQASGAAAEAQQKAALVAASLKDQVIEYAALHLARTALERAKERYRARHQDTLLDRAGAYFRNLTDGAFSGIDIDNEDGSDVLKAVRAASNRPDARVPVSGLSDGTRDQLFLALRLAGIERHLKDREPVPLIVDDVLVNFDDARARATLKCLAELAKQTQVIVFTHHGHLVDLARAVDSATVVHKLTAHGWN